MVYLAASLENATVGCDGCMMLHEAHASSTRPCNLTARNNDGQSCRTLSLLRSMCFTLLDILTSWSDRLMMTRGTVHKPCQFSVCILCVLYVITSDHNKLLQDFVLVSKPSSRTAHTNTITANDSARALQTSTSHQECQWCPYFWHLARYPKTLGIISRDIQHNRVNVSP